MPEPAPSPTEEFVLWISQQSQAVLALEEKGRAALYEAKDETAYRDIMRQKAELLSGLASAAAPLLRALPPSGIRERAENTLAAFSQSAATSLRIGSVFFMSALLYPDEHQAGAPNNLELLANEVAAELR